ASESPQSDVARRAIPSDTPTRDIALRRKVYMKRRSGQVGIEKALIFPETNRAADSGRIPDAAARNPRIGKASGDLSSPPIRFSPLATFIVPPTSHSLPRLFH